MLWTKTEPSSKWKKPTQLFNNEGINILNTTFGSFSDIEASSICMEMILTVILIIIVNISLIGLTLETGFVAILNHGGHLRFKEGKSSRKSQKLMSSVAH